MAKPKIVKQSYAELIASFIKNEAALAQTPGCAVRTGVVAALQQKITDFIPNGIKEIMALRAGDWPTAMLLMYPDLPDPAYFRSLAAEWSTEHIYGPYNELEKLQKKLQLIDHKDRDRNRDVGCREADLVRVNLLSEGAHV